MKKKIFLIVFALLGTTSQLSAQATETSEDRQKDTFTLYDRNRRELNWQRQRARRQAQVNDSRGDRAYRGMNRGEYPNNPAPRGGYSRHPYESEYSSFRGYNHPTYYDRGYSQTNYNAGYQHLQSIPASPPVD